MSDFIRKSFRRKSKNLKMNDVFYFLFEFIMCYYHEQWSLTSSYWFASL